MSHVDLHQCKVRKIYVSFSYLPLFQCAPYRQNCIWTDSSLDVFSPPPPTFTENSVRGGNVGYLLEMKRMRPSWYMEFCESRSCASKIFPLNIRHCHEIERITTWSRRRRSCVCSHTEITITVSVFFTSTKSVTKFFRNTKNLRIFELFIPFGQSLTLSSIKFSILTLRK